MTGLERWAAAHQASPREISVLLETENPSFWKNVLGASLDSEKLVPPGCGAALEELLRRGRAGLIGVPVDVIAAHADTTAENVVRTASAAFPELIATESGTDASEPLRVRSHTLPALLAKIADPDRRIGTLPAPEASYGEDVPAGSPIPSGEAPEEDGMPDHEGQRIGRPKPLGASARRSEIRAFLLSLPRCKAQDVALMMDREVRDAFARDYAAFPAGGGTIVLPPAMLDELSRLLCSGGAHFLRPAARPGPAEAEDRRPG